MERQLLKAKETISRLEKEKLATVDRFRPATDQDVVDLFKQVQNKAKTLSNFLAKQMVSDLKESEWMAGMMKLTWDIAYSPDIRGIDPKKNTDFRKQLWRLFIWNWLNDTIIGGPFSSYGGPGNYPESLQACYYTLFQNPENLRFSHPSKSTSLSLTMPTDQTS